MRAFLLGIAAGVVVAAAGSSCGQSVNCENLCIRLLTCEVTYAPSDDIEGTKVANGERTELEHCTLGCQEHDISIESAQCVDTVTETDQNPSTCQGKVTDCLGVTVVE